MPRTYLGKSLFSAALTGALSTGISADTSSGERSATVIAALAPLFECQDWYVAWSLYWLREISHGMANQNTFVQLLLLDEFLHVFGHHTIGMFRGME